MRAEIVAVLPEPAGNDGTEVEGELGADGESGARCGWSWKVLSFSALMVREVGRDTP